MNGGLHSEDGGISIPLRKTELERDLVRTDHICSENHVYPTYQGRVSFIFIMGQHVFGRSYGELKGTRI